MFPTFRRALGHLLESPIGDKARWGWWETMALLGYVAVVASGVRWHEGWTDEAQAWMIARDMGWWQMMLHGVRYEGTPGLWHSVLWVMARLHLSYIGMHYAAALLAVAGAAVLLRWAPFPRYLKLLIPFTFFLAYQDAVVARSYVLFAGLGFGAAALLRGRIRRPLLLAVLLGLIAQISIHGCIASGGLAIVAAVEAWQAGLHRMRRYQAAAGLLLLFWLLAIATAAPPRDLDFAAAKNLHKARIWVRDSQGGHWVYGNDQIPVDPDPSKPHLVTRKDARGSATMQPGELAPIPLQRAHLPFGRRLWLRVAHLLGLVTFPISTSRSLAVGTVVLWVMLVWGRTRAGEPAPRQGLGRLALIPPVLMVAAFSKLYVAPRHAGVLFTLFVISLWLAWPESELQEELTPRRQWQRVALTTMLLLVAVQQIGWTEDAILADKHYPYSGDWTTARFLKTAREDGPVAGFYYHAIGALAYLPGYHYMNQPHSYWLWSKNLRIDQEAPKVLAQKPLYVVVGGFTWGDQGDLMVDWGNPYDGSPLMPMADSYRIMRYFERHGYIETHRFCGRLLMRDGYSEEVCNMVLEPYAPED